jgi:uncharacterized protein YggE
MQPIRYICLNDMSQGSNPAYNDGEKMIRPLLYSYVLLLALASTVPSAAQAQILPAQALAGTRLDIVATGDVGQVPDVAQIGAGVVTQAGSAANAMAENARRTAATIATLKKAGIADRDIQTSAINLSPQYKYADNQPPVITGYQASNRLGVRFRDIRKAGGILDALVAAGANQIDGPSLSIDKPEGLLDEAREKAMVAARARATLYAKATGLQVKRIISISESVNEPPRIYPMAMMARGKENADTAIEPGEQKLSVSVSVTFELN